VVRRVVFAVPGDLDTPTGGYAYDKRVISELRDDGWTVDVVDLGRTFPRPDDAARTAAVAMLSTIPDGTPTVVDGLAYGVLPELAETLCRRVPVIALVHHPLALESGLVPDDAARLRASERTALAAARAVVVTSDATARLLVADYDLPPRKIMVAQPGTDRVAAADRTGRAGPVALLAVGAVVPRKGYDVLLEALSRLVDLDWRLAVVGPLDRDPATAAAIAAQITTLALADRVTLAGAVAADELAGLYAGADAFVLASRFEGYGMAFSEALGYGLPVVGTTGGAIPDTVPTGAGLLVAPDDVEALALALRRVIGEPGTRERLARAARAAADRLPTWRDTARRFAATIETIEAMT
jgi:glycosyltransferase involved in cell wall biosynthesis